jgi:hypothetical protein
METYYTHMRGFQFFLDVTGVAFNGTYVLKVSNVGEQAIASLAAGNESWVWGEPREIPRGRIN